MNKSFSTSVGGKDIIAVSKRQAVAGVAIGVIVIDIRYPLLPGNVAKCDHLARLAMIWVEPDRDSILLQTRLQVATRPSE